VLWLITLISFSFSLSAAAVVLEPSKHDSGLYKYWAQFYTGSDLVTDDINQLEPSSLREVKVGVFDGEFDLKYLKNISDTPVFGNKLLFNTSESPHANLVWHLIAGYPRISGSSGPVSLEVLALAGEYSGVGKNLLSQKRNIDLANVSHENRPRFSNLIEESPKLSNPLLTETKFVCSSGNYYPGPADQVNDGPCILVGSMSPEGFVSGFSMEGEAVVVLAPSDRELLSHDGKSEQLFGGTSGASPQVTAALANIMHFKKFNHYTYEDLEMLLRRTAIPIPQIKNGKNGAGFLNSYQLYRVARLLRYSKISRDNINRAIQKLQGEAEERLNQVGQLDSSSEQWRNLRIAFHLGSQKIRKKAAMHLARIFSFQNLYRTANFYRNFATDFTKIRLEDLLQQKNRSQHASLRFWLDTQALSNSEIKKIFDRAKPFGRIAILGKFASDGVEEDFLVVNTADSGSLGETSVGEFAIYLLQAFYDK
jgi:hypothetical protein